MILAFLGLGFPIFEVDRFEIEPSLSTPVCTGQHAGHMVAFPHMVSLPVHTQILMNLKKLLWGKQIPQTICNHHNY